MLVVSMSDFLGDPAQYMERARHGTVLVENADGNVKLSGARRGVFAVVAGLFKPKPRQLGTLRKKGSVTFIGDWEVTPEELFDDDDEDLLPQADALKRG